MTIHPSLQPDVDLAQIASIAALNPVVVGLGLWLGRTCNQPQKLLVAGFAAGLAGMVPLWLAAQLQLPFMAEAGRAASGILVLQSVIGMVWAGIGYRFLPR